MENYDYLFKCVIVGDGGAGKTAMVVRFSQGFFQESYKLTIGVEFAVKSIVLEDKSDRHVVKLQIWDTGGQDRFVYVRPLYYKGAMGCIVVFDLTSRESFDHIARWIAEVQKESGSIPMLLVGNKSDLTNARVVSRKEAEKLAEDLNMFYIESSAKSGNGVGDVFAILAYLMMGEPVPQKFLEIQEIEHAPIPIVETPSLPTLSNELNKESAVPTENSHIPPPPKVMTPPPSPPSRPSLHAPIVRIPSESMETQKISEPEWFAPKVSPRPSPLSTIPATPPLQPQIQQTIIPCKEPMIIKPKPIPKSLPVVPTIPSPPRQVIKTPTTPIIRDLPDPPVSPSIPLPPSTSTFAPQVPPKPNIQPSKPSTTQKNPFLIQSKKPTLPKPGLFTNNSPKPPSPATSGKKTKKKGANFANFLNTLQKSPPSEKKSANLFPKSNPQIIRPTASGSFLKKKDLISPKKKSKTPTPAPQQASWISNLDAHEKKPDVQKKQLESFIKKPQPTRPPTPSPTTPKDSTPNLFFDNIARDKPAEVKPSHGKPNNLLFQPSIKNTPQSPMKTKSLAKSDNKTHDCPRCGATLNKKFRFCNKCGSRIN